MKKNNNSENKCILKCQDIDQDNKAYNSLIKTTEPINKDLKNYYDSLTKLEFINKINKINENYDSLKKITEPINRVKKNNDDLIRSILDKKTELNLKNNKNSYEDWKHGAVTFLDVLGWKGIYKTDKLAIHSLIKLISQTKKFSKSETDKSIECGYLPKNSMTEVISISDTIAILTECDTEECDPGAVLNIHAKICQYILPKSLESKIPLRGAISYGKYSYYENIMVGPAIDEAASWHEMTNWIGVIFSPTAQIHLRNTRFNSIVTYDSIPFKQNFKNLKTCVDWEYDTNSKELKKLILEMGPQVPEIANKYLNTICFLEREKDRGCSPENDPGCLLEKDLICST